MRNTLKLFSFLLTLVGILVFAAGYAGMMFYDFVSLDLLRTTAPVLFVCGLLAVCAGGVSLAINGPLPFLQEKTLEIGALAALFVLMSALLLKYWQQQDFVGVGFMALLIGTGLAMGVAMIRQPPEQYAA